MIKFLKEVKLELQKVQWPTKRQTIRLTAAVIGVSVGVGLFVLALDYIFKESLTWLISLK